MIWFLLCLLSDKYLIVDSSVPEQKLKIQFSLLQSAGHEVIYKLLRISHVYHSM